MNAEPSPPSPTGPGAALIRRHGQLIAAIPPLFGFVPTESAVILGVRRHRIVAVARVELADAADLAQDLTRPGLLAPADAVHIVIVAADQDHPTGRSLGPVPHAQTAATLIAGFSAAGFQVKHAAWIPVLQAGQRWRCYLQAACGGILPDPRSTPLAAAAAVAGQITYPSRQAMAHTLDPDQPHALHRRATAITAALADRTTDRAGDIRLVHAAVLRAVRGELPTGEEELTELATVLADHAVRDASLAFCLDQRSAAAVQRLWTTLVRSTPAPYRAEPAVLLAVTAYLHGDSVLAGIATEAALHAQPAHRLADIIRIAIRLGLPASDLRAAATETLHPH